MFLNGCQPFYTWNSFVNDVWWGVQDPDDCPSKTTIFSQPNGPNYAEAWKCVPAAPGFSPA